MPRCGNSCGQQGTKRCARCKTVYYCSQKCQKAHWKIHKKGCSEIQSTKAVEECMGGFRTRDADHKNLSQIFSWMQMMSSRDGNMIPIPEFHEEYKRRFPKDGVDYRKLQTQWNSEQISFGLLRKGKIDNILKNFGTVHQVLTKRWFFMGEELLTYLLSNPDLGDIFTEHPQLQHSSGLEYGTRRGGLRGLERHYQTMRNTPVQKAVFEEGKAYVSVGFVDLHELIYADFILQEDADSSSKVQYIGYEMSEIAVARAKIILELLYSDVAVETILQIWFSSCLTTSAQTVLEKVCQALLVKEEDAKLKTLFEFWNSNTIDLKSAKLRWSQYLSDSQMKLLDNLRKEQDRVEYARYLLTGQIFFKDGERPSFGNSTMFELPKGYDNYKKNSESFFYTMSMHDFPYSESLMNSAVGKTILGVQDLRSLMKNNKIEIILKVNKFELGEEKLFKEVKSYNPKKINWSNIPDYMTADKFLTMAKKCSADLTVHTFHIMNWVKVVYGACLIDYFPLEIALSYGTLVDHNGQAERKYRELEAEYNARFFAARSSQPFLREDQIFENVMNISDQILADQFKGKFIEFMFKNYSVELLETKMEPFNVFQSAGSIVFTEFKFLGSLM